MGKWTKRILAAFCVIVTSAPGPILWMAYKATIAFDNSLSLSLNKQKGNLSVILATYSFTMLGFLAAVMAILLGSSQSRAFKKYKQSKYLDLFFLVYFICIATLATTFLFSILSLSSVPTASIMHAAVASAVNSVMQVAIITSVIMGICKRSM